MVVFRFLRRLGDRIWNGTPMSDETRRALADSRRDRDSLTNINLGSQTTGIGIGRG